MESIVEALRKAYEAFNRGDIRNCLAALHPNIEWIEPKEFPGGGTYHGHADVARYLTQSRDAWAEVRSEPEKTIEAGDKIVIFVHARVRPRDSDAVTDVCLADVYTIAGGKAVRMRAFNDRTEALRYAGLAPGIESGDCERRTGAGTRSG